MGRPHPPRPQRLYWDRIDLNGDIEKSQWSYNQGLMLGNAVLRHLATGDAAALQQAKQLAATAIAHFTAGDRWLQQPRAFNAIFFRNLAVLDHVAPDPAYRKALRNYTTLANRHWLDPTTGRAHLLHQAATVECAAALAAPPRERARLMPPNRPTGATPADREVA